MQRFQVFENLWAVVWQAGVSCKDLAGGVLLLYSFLSCFIRLCSYTLNLNPKT